MTIEKVKFLSSVGFGSQSYSIGDEVGADEFPEKVLTKLIENKTVEIIGASMITVDDGADAGESYEVETDDAEAEDVPEWPLKTPPEEYLEEKPDGPNAGLARRILDS